MLISYEKCFYIQATKQNCEFCRVLKLFPNINFIHRVFFYTCLKRLTRIKMCNQCHQLPCSCASSNSQVSRTNTNQGDSQYQGGYQYQANSQHQGNSQYQGGYQYQGNSQHQGNSHFGSLDSGYFDVSPQVSLFI